MTMRYGSALGTIALAFLLALSFTACTASDREIVVPASPEDGFHFPYVIALPRGELSDAPPFLLVEPNNTGTVSDDEEKHREAALRMVRGSSLGYGFAQDLGVPFLVPMFPRPETDWKIYTHSLDRDCLRIEDGPLQRLDLQLVAMIEHGREVLAEHGLEVNPKVLLNGFSASGTFSNRFTFLHPEVVLAVACGGVNGILMLPLESLDDTKLGFPLGVADLQELTGRPFDREAWQKVPQFLYMGAEDDNDAVAYADGYDDDEREVVHAVLGEAMMPDRWNTCQRVYRESEGNITLRTYEGIGHATNREINAEVAAFLRDAMKQ